MFSTLSRNPEKGATSKCVCYACNEELRVRSKNSSFECLYSILKGGFFFHCYITELDFLEDATVSPCNVRSWKTFPGAGLQWFL